MLKSGHQDFGDAGGAGPRTTSAAGFKGRFVRAKGRGYGGEVAGLWEESIPAEEKQIVYGHYI